MNVVLAHPDPGSLRRFVRVLTHVGHDVRAFGTAGEAVGACRERPPDVALVDVELCRDDGRDLLAELKGDPEAYRSAVLLLERHDLALDAAVTALRGGAQDFLVEPVSDAELVARVDAAGRTKVLQEELVVQSERLEALLFEDPLTRPLQPPLHPHAARGRRQRRPPPRARAVDRHDRHRPLQGRQRRRGNRRRSCCGAPTRRSWRPSGPAVTGPKVLLLPCSAAHDPDRRR